MRDSDGTYVVDIAVFGAGPAGLAAAWQAGMSGKNVCLIEVQDRIGGVMGSCPGMMLGAGYPTGQSVGGFFEEFVDRMYKHTPPVAERRTCSLENFGDEVVYKHEYAELILYEMLKEAHVDIFLNTITSQVNMKNDKIVSVDVAMINKTMEINSGIYIDCTGNGEIAHRAGVKSQKGNEEGLMMGASLTFFMDNVDCDKVFSNSEAPYFEAYAEEGIKNKQLHKSIPQIYMLPAYKKNTVFVNTVTVTDVDGTDSQSVLEGTVIAKRRVLELADFLIQNIPGFEKSWISTIGQSVGVRETRKLEGMYTITYDDIFNGVKFEDGIVACDNPLDEVFRDEKTTHYSHEAALNSGYYTIPVRALIPKKIKNLLFAGRCISADSKAFASVRGMPQCMLMGQSVALVADMALQEEIPVQKVDVKTVSLKMKELGVWGI